MTTPQFGTIRLDQARSRFHRPLWLEVGSGIGLVILLFVLHSQSELGSQVFPTSVADWQSQAWQQQTAWQIQLRQIIPVFSTLHQPTSDGTDQTARQSLQAQVDQIKAENEQLRAALNLESARFDSDSLLRVPVMSKSQRLIEFPSQNLPKTQQLILSSQGLLGWIDQVTGQRAHVLVLRDNSKLRLAVSTQRGASGLLINRRGVLVLTEVPTTASLQEGDTVVTMSQVMVPGGVPIGTVQQVTKDESGVVQSANVQPGVDFGEEAVVWVKKE